MNMASKTRRSFLNSALAALRAWGPGRAWPKAPPPAPENPGALGLAIERASGGRAAPASEQVALSAPDLAEDGALVPVTVASALPGVEAVWVFVENNPVPLAACFQLEASLDAFVSLRVKMNASGEVVALVKAGEAYFSARKTVRVVVGGCG